MTDIAKPIQGVLNIGNVQGNYRSIELVFTDGSNNPIDLTTYQGIRMEIKEMFSVQYTPFLTFTVGSGLVISGGSNNVMTFELDEAFWLSQVKKWVYDITFLINGERYTYIRGEITNDLTASKL